VLEVSRSQAPQPKTKASYTPQEYQADCVKTTLKSISQLETST